MRAAVIISRSIFLGMIFCMSHLCRASNRYDGSLPEFKLAMAGEDFFPHFFVTTTTDTNRTERVVKLRQILGASLANPTSPDIECPDVSRTMLVCRAMTGYVAIAHENNHTMCATLLPFLGHPDKAVQVSAIRLLGKVGDSFALDALKLKLRQTEAMLPDASILTSSIPTKEIEDAFEPEGLRSALLYAFLRINTPEASDAYTQAVGRYKTKYQGTELGRRMIEEFTEHEKRMREDIALLKSAGW